MLRVMDDSQTRPVRGWVSLLVLGVMASFAIATTALRAYSQNEPVKSDPPVASPETIRDNEADMATIGAALFRRPKVSASQPVFGDKGGVHLDLEHFHNSSSVPLPSPVPTALEEVQAVLRRRTRPT